MEYLPYIFIAVILLHLLYGVHKDFIQFAKADALFDAECLLIHKALTESTTLEQQNAMLADAKTLNAKAFEMLK